ncbi:hypothetical protein Aperf_G00000037465 [Anoplocephala perfoliata]
MSRNRSAQRYGREARGVRNHRSFQSRDHGDLPARFEELGFNYGFAQADPSKNCGYCLVYRTLKNNMERTGAVCRIRADEEEIQLTELEGPRGEREEVTIFAHDVVSYYKFSQGGKFIAICIDAYQRKKTGYWFLCFEREGQLKAFCNYLNWLFGLEVLDSYEETEDGRVSYVDRRTKSIQSFDLSQPYRGYDRDSRDESQYERDTYDSGYTEVSSDIYTSSETYVPPRKIPHPKYSPWKTSGKRNFRRY